MFKMIKRMSFVIGIILVLILSFSYGTFIYTSDSYRTTEMLVSNLTYGIDITSSDATVSGKTVSVSSGTTAVVYLKVTSLNKIDTKYGIDYKITKGTGTVKYASNTGWLPTGKISENNVGTYEKVVKVVISATTDVTVDFTVTGGFTNNVLTEVETGYTRITEKADNVISYNDTLTNVVKKETTNNIYGGESTNNYAQYPINEDNTKNIWRILGNYTDVGIKIVSNQISTTTKSTLSTDLTSFYNTLEKPDNYILATDKFACTNTSCTSSSYSKVGLISTSEYEMLGGINSYLASSESYFALDNGIVKNITSGGIEETSTTSGLRPAVYLQDYVTVTGSGTVSDPFKLKMPEYAVVLNVVNGSAALPSKMITRGENATYEITPNSGYTSEGATISCDGGATASISGEYAHVRNVYQNQTCTVNFKKLEYNVTVTVVNGSGGGTQTVSHGSNAVYVVTPNIGYKTELETDTCGGTLSGNTYTINNVTSDKNCSITFKSDNPFSSGTLAAKMYIDNPTRSMRNTFDIAFTNSTTGTLFTATEKNVHNSTDTTVYYYAGNTTNNWVKFGGYYWRIIRTNADGSIRMLYSGTSHDTTSGYIGTSYFNSSYNSPKYVGYMYGNDASSLANARINTNNSTIKTTIDNWYASNMTSYTKYLSTTAVYCSDRDLDNGQTWSSSSNFNYITYTRLGWEGNGANANPTYDCTNSYDAFSASNSYAKLTYPIALMTGDEVSFAGGLTNNVVPAWYYLNSAGESITGSTWWYSMSPLRQYSTCAFVWGVVGSEAPGLLGCFAVDRLFGARPVTSLKSCVKWKSGDGTPENPYTIKETTSGC